MYSQCDKVLISKSDVEQIGMLLSVSSILLYSEGLTQETTDVTCIGMTIHSSDKYMRRGL